ncbi:thioredoxin domain-containing protein [Maribacter sp. 2304DJ31-5]|uniref:thioredoxin domain-containing protein n=1 Tax=Maribacter sp. 2304DJ31-5 TaxID=3386273 RepID=UPI0039BD6CB6
MYSINKVIFSFLKKYVLLITIAISSISCQIKTDSTKETKHKYTNSLIHETSPYLLQHAHNPVDWRAWGQEALDKAKEENKLILVSIGYSSCHWCHVMEEETFENDSIAKLMNENFINIKVDREERPDVDQVYMTAVQLMTGNNGGWPLNVITLPNGKPLYGGTYHTKGQWERVLAEISRLYKENPEKAEQYSDRVAQGIQEVNIISPSTDVESLKKEVLAESLDNWKTNWDAVWGGDKREQKFMIPVNLEFLLNYGILTNEPDILGHLELTLDKMAMGGLRDHIGGGFFRYSTDPVWKVPHFEKMLYDNAQALSLYSKAYKVFKKESYKDVALDIIEFLEREMKNPEGGYYAALDADSEGEEGKFYVWSQAELKTVLGSEFELFSKYFTIREDAVWEEGKYVLHQLKNDTDFITETAISKSILRKKKKQWATLLLNARKNRVRPRTDDKIITSWNALLINGYTEAYAAFGNADFLDRGISILDFIMDKNYNRGKLGHSYKTNSKYIDGFLEDYSFLANAALKLYSTTTDQKYLELAHDLTKTAQHNFSDEDSDMYTYNQGNELISKLIKTDDGTIPSPNAVMAHNLFQLGHINYDTDKIKKSEQMLSAMVPLLKENAYSYAMWATLFSHITFPYYEVAVVGAKAQTLLKGLNKTYIPNILLVGSTAESNLPLFEGRYDDEDTFIYVCRNNTCKLPVNTVNAALDLLRPKKSSAISPVSGLENID